MCDKLLGAHGRNDMCATAVETCDVWCVRSCWAHVKAVVAHVPEVLSISICNVCVFEVV